MVGDTGQADRVPPRTVRIAPGRDVPYPQPSSAAASAVGRANRRRDTKPEVQLRSALHRQGLQFRKDRLVRYPGGRVRVDICFPRARVAVFIDGCFWHVCPIHHHSPRRNPSYWGPKLEANVARDRRNDAALTDLGWQVVRIWEHEEVEAAVGRVIGALGVVSRAG